MKRDGYSANLDPVEQELVPSLRAVEKLVDLLGTVSNGHGIDWVR